MPPIAPSAAELYDRPQLVWSAADGAISVALVAPVARAELVAPSYAGWLTDPRREARLDNAFVARAPETIGIASFQKVIAVPPSAALSPPSATPAASTPPTSTLATALPLAVPLPPKRLAEKRNIVLASLAPMPPARLAEPLSFAPQPAAAQDPMPPETASTPADDGVEQQADAPQQDAAQEDAARPIDDSPEPSASRATADRAPPQIEALIQIHADRFDVPVWLVRRVAWRESKFDPSRRNGPYWGLMQIRVDTARGLGFRGQPKDLLDADTNMTYAVAYLANAYRVAGRDEKRAVMLYAKGYYYEAKRKRMLASLIRTARTED